MDKLLIDQYGNAILYKVDTNSIKNVSDNFECRIVGWSSNNRRGSNRL